MNSEDKKDSTELAEDGDASLLQDSSSEIQQRILLYSIRQESTSSDEEDDEDDEEEVVGDLHLHHHNNHHHLHHGNNLDSIMLGDISSNSIEETDEESENKNNSNNNNSNNDNNYDDDSENNISNHNGNDNDGYIPLDDFGDYLGFDVEGDNYNDNENDDIFHPRTDSGFIEYKENDTHDHSNDNYNHNDSNHHMIHGIFMGNNEEVEMSEGERKLSEDTAIKSHSKPSIPPLSQEKINIIRQAMSQIRLKGRPGIDSVVESIERARIRVGDEM